MAGSGNGAARRFNTAGICYPEEHYMVNMEKQRCLICLQKGFPAGMPYCLSALKE